MQLVTISTSRNILKSGSRDRARMRMYAGYLEHLHIIVLTRRSHGFHENMHEGNLHVYPTNSSSTIMMLFNAFRLAHRVLRDRKGNDGVTITVQDPLELGLIARVLSRIHRVPYTIQIHGDYYSRYWTQGSIVRSVRRCLIPYVLHAASKIRVVSLRVADSLRLRGFPNEKIVVLPIRPELDMFLKVARPPKNETFTILTVSRFAREKNIPCLIRAFSRALQDHPGMQLRIVGEGGEYARIQHEIVSLGIESSVRCEPWTDTIAEHMASADVFVLASLHESYGLVLIEALATGTPVITTDVGCVGSVVKDGEHGIVVPVQDEERLYHALVRMYTDETFRISAGENGRALGKQLSSMTEEMYAKEWVAAHSA